MPHLVILSTPNLERETDMTALCRSLADTTLGDDVIGVVTNIADLTAQDTQLVSEFSASRTASRAVPWARPGDSSRR